jgi:hypothetical protein
MKMNKTGGEKLLSMWWIFVLVIIGAGIVLGVLIYHSKEINVNEVEAEVLGEKIIDCITDNGYLNLNVLKSDFDFFQECKLEKSILGVNNAGEFYLGIFIYNAGAEVVKNISFGDLSIKKDCDISMNINAKYFAKCSLKESYAISNNKNLKIIVVTGVNQKGNKK